MVYQRKAARSSLRHSIRGIALACAVASACASSQRPGAEKPAADSADGASSLAVLDEARTLDGSPLERRASAKATLVIFFASWCGPCRHELHLLSHLRVKYPDLEIIGFNVYEDFRERSDRERLDAFLAEHAPWLQVAVADGDVLRHFGGIPKIPSVFVYDGGGVGVAEFRANQRRSPGRQELETAIRTALGTAQSSL